MRKSQRIVRRSMREGMAWCRNVDARGAETWRWDLATDRSVLR